MFAIFDNNVWFGVRERVWSVSWLCPTTVTKKEAHDTCNYRFLDGAGHTTRPGGQCMGTCTSPFVHNTSICSSLFQSIVLCSVSFTTGPQHGSQHNVVPVVS